MKMTRQLKNKPLVEAFVELKWQLESVPPGVLRDPAFPLFLGRFHEQLRAGYPYVEPLPTAELPNEVTPHMVKYRFRTAKDGWPVVQTGPGVATLNFTASYHWDVFLQAARDFFLHLVGAYAGEGNGPRPRFTSALLQYINAVDFDVATQSVLDHLDQAFHTHFALPVALSDCEEVSGPPQAIHLAATYPLRKPAGTSSVRFATGSHAGKPALFWELHVLSSNEQTPQDDKGFEAWLTDAHCVAENWFFSLIKGELERTFDKEV